MANEPVETKNEIVEEAINKLMSDDEKIKEILTANSSEEMKESFKSVGLELTDEQIEVFKKNFIDGMNAEINKLPAEEREKLIKKASEAELEKISGGALKNTQIGLGGGLIVGAAISAAVGLFGSFIGYAQDAEDSYEKPPREILKHVFGKSIKIMAGIIGVSAAVGATAGACVDLIEPSEPKKGDLLLLDQECNPPSSENIYTTKSLII